MNDLSVVKEKGSIANAKGLKDDIALLSEDDIKSLNDEATSLSSELMSLRFKNANGDLSDYSKIKKLKIAIARILTKKSLFLKKRKHK